MRNRKAFTVGVRALALEVLENLLAVGNYVNRIFKPALAEGRPYQEDIIRAVIGQQNVFQIAHNPACIIFLEGTRCTSPHRAASWKCKSTFESGWVDGPRPAFLFGNRNQAALILQPGHFAQRTPAEFACFPPKLGGSQTRMDQIIYLLVWQEEFINRDAPAVSFFVAFNAPASSPGFGFFRPNREGDSHFFANRLRNRALLFGTMAANPAREPL